MNVLSGKLFNEKYPTKEFYKVLTKDCTHFGFQYKHGINVDHIPFNPTGSCSAGGLYFTELLNLPMWISLGSIYIAKVLIPPEARVYFEKNSFKSDTFYIDLNNKISVEEFIWEKNASGFIFSVSFNNAHLLRFVKDQTDEICKCAVQKDCYALRFVKDQTDEICELVVCKNGIALQYVKNQTNRLCELAVSQEGTTLQYVLLQTDEICKLAVSQNGEALQYVLLQTDEICKIAVSQTGSALRYVILQTDEICKPNWFSFTFCEKTNGRNM